VRLRFGKYRGWHVSEIPLAYLAWIFESLTGKPELHEAARQEILRRVSGYEWEPEPVDPDRVRRVYKTLALEHHPDRGGDGRIMAGINLFFEAMND